MPLRLRPLGLALLALCTLLGALPAGAATGEALLELAFARADSAAARFAPFRFHEETRTRVSNGDDVLEHEERAWLDGIQWGPDSTEVLAEGGELVYDRKAKPGEEPEAKAKDGDEDDGDERKLDLSFDFFTAARRGEYRFEPGESRGARGDRRAGAA